LARPCRYIAKVSGLARTGCNSCVIAEANTGVTGVTDKGVSEQT